MKRNNAWTLALIGAGLVSLPAVTPAEEKPSSVMTALSSTTISGYVDTSAQWNLGSGNANVPTYAFGGTSKADGFNLNVVKLALEKPVDAADAWGAGYKTELLFGPDADALHTQSTGTTGDFAIKQAYVALHAPVANGLDFKIGVFDTIIGYEGFDASSQPNFTRSYGYSIEPTTHTGILMSYQFCDWFSATAGIADTYGPTINGRAFLNGGTSLAQVPDPANPGATIGEQGPKAESYKTYMASATFTAPTNWGVLGGATLTGCIINGFNSGSTTGGGADQTSYYIGGNMNTPITGLKVGACYDYAGTSSDQGSDMFGVPIPSSHANAVATYCSFQATEKLGLYGRAEYASASTPSPFLAKEVIAFTATVQYDLWKNVLSRVEARWDHACTGSPYGGTTAGPASATNPNGGSEKNSVIFLANIVYKF
jgi:hypothetical protein